MLSLILVLAIQKSTPADLDFWVGDWDCVVSSRNPKSASGWDESKAVEHVTKEYDGRVIHESFESEGYGGMSVSTLDARRGTWRQTWVDQTGRFVTCEGGLVGSKFVFTTLPEKKLPVTKLIFDEMDKDRLTWHVERKNPKSGNFETVIKMVYTRKDK
jgi:hypothetical protein